MKTVMNHSQDGGLLKMIRRTDPAILRAARADPNSFEVCRVAREIQQMLNLGYPWIVGKIVVSLQQNNKRIMEAKKI